jgi:hypothetical protein
MALDANGGSGHCLGATGGLGDSGGDDSTRRRFRWALDATGGSGYSLGATGGRGDSGDDGSTRRRFKGGLDRSLRVGLLRTDGDLGLLWGVSSESASQSVTNGIMAGGGGLS